MKKRSLFKGIIAVLFLFLCVEVGVVVYQINSGTNAFARNLDLGNKYLLSEDYDSAISAFSKAIEIDSMNADAYIGRGDAYKAKGDYASAWEDYEKAQELSGNPDIIRDKIGLTEISIVSEDGSGVDGASVKLSGSDHSYEFVTNSSGRISEVIFPEKYKMEVVKDRFDPVEVELSTEEGGTEIGHIQLQRAIDLSAPILQVENVHKEGKNGLCTMDYSRVSDDARFNTYGVPRNKTKSAKKKSDKKETVPNANYLWIGYFATALNENGKAALVMANSASDAGKSEYEIRKKLIEAGIISQMVTLPSNMFSSVTLPATLWFFANSATSRSKISVSSRACITAIPRRLPRCCRSIKAS